MRRIFVLLLVISQFACGSREETTTETTDTDSSSLNIEPALEVATEVSTQAIDSFCHLQVGGITKQDTKALKLVIKNNDVTGELLYLPHEKDGRFGLLSGKKQGDTINAIWRYMQEGMEDTVSVSFVLTENGVMQQRSSFNTRTGREYLPAKGPYDITYTRTDCSILPQYNIGKYFRDTTRASQQ
jgi:hypothetical protein